MRANQFIPEAAIGTNPKRPSRPGSRPERGHEPQKRYVTDRKTGKQYDPDEQFNKTMNSPEVKAQMKRMAMKEAGNKALEPHIGMGDSRTPRELKAQMKGSSDEFVKSSAGKKPGVFHSKVAHMQNKLAKSELRNREKGVAEGAKVDRMIGHIAASERKRGKSPEVAQDIAYATANKRGYLNNKNKKKLKEMAEEIARIEAELAENNPTSKKVCLSSVSDDDLGASQLASCKSQGLRARKGKKSHLIGHSGNKVRITVGGKKIKGKEYGGPLPDYGTRKGQ